MSEPLVPVTVTVNDPAVVPVIASVDVPDPEMLAALSVAVRLGSDAVALSETVPENPFNPVIVIVEVADAPAVKLTVAGFAVMEKSGAGVTVNITVVVCTSIPLVPVTATVTLPVVANVHESVEVPEPPATEVELRVHPVLSLVNATVLVKPFSGETVTVDVPEVAIVTETVDGLAEIEKSGAAVTVNVTVAEWDREPLVPVTVTTTVPAAVKVQVRVEVPVPPVIVVEDREHPALSEARVTLAVKPFRGEIEMVEVPAEFTATGTAVGLEVILKSGAAVTVNATVAV